MPIVLVILALEDQSQLLFVSSQIMDELFKVQLPIKVLVFRLLKMKVCSQLKYHYLFSAIKDM